MTEDLALGLMTTPVLAVRAEQTLASVWETFRSVSVHHLVVFDDDHLAGVVDKRDLIDALPPTETSEAAQTLTVRDILRATAVCVRWDASATVVAATLNELALEALPVVDERGAVRGIVTATDIVRHLAQRGVSRSGEAVMP